MYTVGSYLAARLSQIGLKHHFAVAGDFNLVLLDQLLTNKDLEQVYCCNELNCGYSAEGYARACGAAAAVVTFSVGGLSAINAIGGAYAENLPGHPGVRRAQQQRSRDRAPGAPYACDPRLHLSVGDRQEANLRRGRHHFGGGSALPDRSCDRYRASGEEAGLYRDCLQPRRGSLCGAGADQRGRQ